MIIARFQNGKENQESAEWRRRHYRNAIVWFVLIVVFFILGTISTFAQFGQGVAAGAWEPRNYKTKLGLVADWDHGAVSQTTLNGAGVSQVRDRSWQTGRLENLLLNSETFATTWTRSAVNAFGVDDSGLTNSGSFANSARTLDPLGGNTADFIQEDNTATTIHILRQPVSYLAGTYTFSIYAKPGGRNWIRVYIGLNSGATQASYYFDVQNGIVGTNTAVGSVSGVSSSIQSVANGFYRCSVTATIGVTFDSCTVYIASADNTPSYTGNSTDGLFIWGAQLRRSTSSSTYVATTTVAEDASRSLNQTTAGNQPLISRADNKGNLALQSETFSTTWALSLCNAFGATDTGATNAGSFANTSRTLDPLSGNTADFIQEDASAASVHKISQSIALPATTCVYSIYAKKAGVTWIYMLSISGGNFFGGYFDLQNGVTGSVVSGGTATGVALSISSAGNDWYLCSVTATLGTAASYSTEVRLAASDGVQIINGNSTDGLFIWGASLRQSSWDSDYIPTVATIAVPGLNGRTTAYFDGAAYYLKTAGMASLVQPETVIWAGKQVTWTASDTFFDGISIDLMRLWQRNASPQLNLRAGVADNFFNTNLVLDSWASVVSVFNATGSSIQVDKLSPATGSAGTNSGAGFTLGSNGGNVANANIQVARVLLSNKVLATNELEYLRHGPLKMVGAR